MSTTLAAPAMMSEQEYLHSSFSPDVDFVDDHIEERNLGEYDHANLQGLITALLLSRAREWRISVLPEQRVQVSSARYRVPDITVIRRKPKTGIITEAPFLCVEILSPEDRLKRTEQRIREYLQMGVPFVWLIDPEDLTGRVYRNDSMQLVTDGIYEAGAIRMDIHNDLPQQFAEEGEEES